MSSQSGREKIQDGKISFWGKIENAGNADIVVLSGVLQYVENYKGMAAATVNVRPRYIVLDRTPVAENSRIAVEYVSEEICKSSYPVRIFRETEIMGLMEGYSLKVKFHSLVDHDFYIEDQKVDMICMIFELGEEAYEEDNSVWAWKDV